MLNKGWLPLNEYSTKYRVSLSTLRRRIRSSEVAFQFEEGKYWLEDRAMAKPAHSAKSISNVAAEHPIEAQSSYAPQANFVASPAEAHRPVAASSEATAVNAEGLLHSAQGLLQELKNAYVKVLHEKEEQITQLKEEVIDLKTLVKILESENDRLQFNMRESAPIDGWLDDNIDRNTER